MDTQAAGLPLRRSTHFVSDSLQFTGIDLSDRTSGTMRRRRYGNSNGDDGDGSTTSSGDDDDDINNEGDYGNGMAIRDKEEALVQSVLQRISRVRARGKADVRLNKEELAALERRRQRMREE